MRLLLGTGPLPMIKRLYEWRLNTWEQWAEVSNAAQGNHAILPDSVMRWLLLKMI